MKIFKKRKRKITVNNIKFYYLVIENNYDVKFRAYPINYKTSYFEVAFDWKDAWGINLYLPSTASKLIQYALNNGWNYFDGKQFIKIIYDKNLLGLLDS